MTSEAHVKSSDPWRPWILDPGWVCGVEELTALLPSYLPHCFLVQGGRVPVPLRQGPVRASGVHLHHHPPPAAADAHPLAGGHLAHHLQGVGEVLADLNHHLRHLPVPVLDAEKPSFIL